MRFIPEMRGAHSIRYLRFYSDVIRTYALLYGWNNRGIDVWRFQRRQIETDNTRIQSYITVFCIALIFNDFQ